jgi:hypothetical protein
MTGGARAAGRDEPHRLVVQPPERKGENTAGADIQPLDVVDGKQERPRPGEGAKHAKDRDSDDPATWLAVAVTGDQQSSGQRSLLDCGQSRQLRRVQPIEKITETCEGQGGIRLAASAVSDRDARHLRVKQSPRPNRRLADAGLTRKGQRRRTVGVVADETSHDR